MNSFHLREYCRIDETGMQLLIIAMDRRSYSARAYDRILKVSRMIADLDASLCIRTEPPAEAIQLRSLDRQNRAG
jgi:magnesium chelatase family protein